MRLKIIFFLILVASFSVCAIASVQRTTENPSAEPVQSAHDHQPPNPSVPDQQPIGQGAGMMSPDMMQMMMGQMMSRVRQIAKEETSVRVIAHMSWIMAPPTAVRLKIEQNQLVRVPE